jgi:hypothetical protein
MFLRAEEAFKVSALPIMFYMYTPDLPALRERLLAVESMCRRFGIRDTCAAAKSP